MRKDLPTGNLVFAADASLAGGTMRQAWPPPPPPPYWFADHDDDVAEAFSPPPSPNFVEHLLANIAAPTNSSCEPGSIGCYNTLVTDQQIVSGCAQAPA